MNFKTILSFSFGPVGAAALGFITLPIITWLFSPEDVGRMAMLQVALGLSIQLLTVGFDQAYVREFHEVDNKEGLLLNAITPSFTLTIVLLTLIFFFEPMISSEILFGVKSISLSILVGSCIFISVLSRFLSLVLRMNEKGGLFSFGQILSKLTLLIALGIISLIEFKRTFEDLILLQFITLLMVLLYYCIILRSCIFKVLKSNFDVIFVKKLFSYGWPLSLGGVSFWALTVMDRLFLKEFSTFENIGIYSVASNFAAAGIILQSIFSTIWAPIVFKWAKNDIEVSKIEEISFFLLLIIIFIFFLATAFSFLTSWLLPSKYGDVQLLLASCMIYPLFYTLSETTVIGLSVKRKSKYIMMASLIALICNLMGNYFLIPLYDAKGAAAATAISFWVFLILRTEFSNIKWKRMKSKAIYICSTLVLIFALDFTLSLTGIEVYQLRIIAVIMATYLGFRIYKESKKIRYLRKT